MLAPVAVVKSSASPSLLGSSYAAEASDHQLCSSAPSPQPTSSCFCPGQDASIGVSTAPQGCVLTFPHD